MLKQILITACLVAASAGVFGGSIFLFRQLKLGNSPDESAATAGLNPGNSGNTAPDSADASPQRNKTEAEQITDIAKTMWRLPSPMGLDELNQLTRELEQERTRLQEERGAVTTEKKGLARERADLLEREKIVEANIKELESYLEEATRAQENQSRRAGMMREGEEDFVKRLAKDFEERSLKPKDAAGIISEMDETLALRLLRKLSTSIRSKIYASMGEKDAAKWIGRLQELDILEASATAGGADEKAPSTEE